MALAGSLNYMMIPGTGTFEDMDLCGRTDAPFRYSSSLTTWKGDSIVVSK